MNKRPEEVIPEAVKQVEGERFYQGSYMVDPWRAAEYIGTEWRIYRPWQRNYWRLWIKHFARSDR